MWKTFLFAFCAILVNAAAAQQKTFVVRAGEVPLDVLPPEAIYSFPKFKAGVVYLKDGSTSRQQLNYNLALDEIHFLSAKNDTLAIASPEMVKYIFIDTSEFYYDKNYYEVLYTSGELKLAKKQFLVQSPVRNNTGFEVSSSTSSISMYSNNYYNGHLAKLQIKKDIEMEKKYLLFISDRFNHFLLADKKVFYKLFPEKKAVIDTYLHNNEVNFRDANDLVKLLNLCTSS